MRPRPGDAARLRGAGGGSPWRFRAAHGLGRPGFCGAPARRGRDAACGAAPRHGLAVLVQRAMARLAHLPPGGRALAPTPLRRLADRRRLAAGREGRRGGVRGGRGGLPVAGRALPAAARADHLHAGAALAGFAGQPRDCRHGAGQPAPVRLRLAACALPVRGSPRAAGGPRLPRGYRLGVPAGPPARGVRRYGLVRRARDRAHLRGGPAARPGPRPKPAGAGMAAARRPGAGGAGGRRAPRWRRAAAVQGGGDRLLGGVVRAVVAGRGRVPPRPPQWVRTGGGDRLWPRRLGAGGAAMARAGQRCRGRRAGPAGPAVAGRPGRCAGVTAGRLVASTVGVRLPTDQLLS